MAEILDYFDSINIDVAKRKYYNANKVNAVLEDLRGYAEELVTENERLRAQLSALLASEKKAQFSLEEMQNLYRETLSKAHERADSILREAEVKSDRLTEEAAQKKELAARRMEECIGAVRAREQQNIDFMNAKLQQCLSELEADIPTGSRQTSEAAASRAERSALDENGDSPVDGNAFQSGEGGPHLKELEMQISKLAKEISALESGS